MPDRILLVEDDPLLRELYSSIADDLGSQFHIRTSADAMTALSLIEKEPVDIVVSDLEMPGMSGGEFLTQLERTQPETMRVVISGYTDELAVARCLMFGHRYLLKPVNRKQIVDLMRRVAGLKQKVTQKKIKAILGASHVIPTPPEIYLRLTEALDTPNTSMEELAEIVELDPGLTAKILQIVNSVAFCPVAPVTNVLEGVKMLGVEALRTMILDLHVQKFFDKRIKDKKLLRKIWNHSMKTAVRARELARAENLSAAESQTCFSAGLLHDVGKLIFAAHSGDEFAGIVERSEKKKEPLDKLETEVFGATHADIGAYLLGMWGLPESIVSAVELHHSLDRITTRGFTPLAAVHIAQNLEPQEHRLEPLNLEFVDRIGVTAKLPAWKEMLASL